VPTVSGKIKLITYGTLEIGDVPRFAFIENATPKDITNKPMPRNRYLLKYSVFINAFFPFKLNYLVERSEAVSLVPRQIWYFPNPDN